MSRGCENPTGTRTVLAVYRRHEEWSTYMCTPTCIWARTTGEMEKVWRAGAKARPHGAIKSAAPRQLFHPSALLCSALPADLCRGNEPPILSLCAVAFLPLCVPVVGSGIMGVRSSSVQQLLLCASLVLSVAAAQKYNAVYNFGDSITDTGNLCTNGKPSAITFTQPPYGETYFGSPTCRCSDGRVIVDFLSTKFGLPFLAPSKSSGADFKQGANMAITGATAMDAPFFRSLGLSDKIWNNGPISFQIQWFQQISTSVCGQNCKSYLANSLFVFGEFGGNDYNAMLFGGYTTDQASTYTPQIVDTISKGIEKLIALGAVDIVVPGVLPIGCFPIYLTIYGTSSSGDYDSLGCLKKFNDLSTYHNKQLQNTITGLQAKYKSARIMYADFYSGVYDMVRNPQNYGFSTALQACCGSGGGKYNYANSARCGMKGAAACAKPATYLSWDGIHLTEAAYKQITDGWLSGPYCRPAILHS